MKKFLFIWTLILGGVILHAQDQKPILNSSKTKLPLEKRNLNIDNEALDKVKARPFEAEYQTIFDFKGNEFSKSSVTVAQRDSDGRPSFIKSSLDAKHSDLDINEQLQKYVEQLAPIMNLKLEHCSFLLLKEWEDKLSQKHYKMQQTLNGVPIYGAEIIIHNRSGVLDALNGTYLPSEKLIAQNSSARLDKEDAKNKIINQPGTTYEPFSDQIKSLSDDLEQWKIELVYYQGENKLELAYHIKAYPNIGEWNTYFVDAITGRIITEYSNICKAHFDIGSKKHAPDCNHSHPIPTSKMELPPNGPATANAVDLLGNTVNINTYELGNLFYMIDASRDMFDPNSGSLPHNPYGAIRVLDADNSPYAVGFSFDHVTSTDNTWPLRESVSAQNNGAKAFEYFKDTHDRISIDGNGGSMISFVNVADGDGSSLGNAFWNGIGIYYGNGDFRFKPMARALDVAGHEMSHGVVEHTANLEYQGQSGAINESFADCFGAMIDREDWLIGEDVAKLTAYPSGAMRNIADPTNGAPFGDYNAGYQPSHMDDIFTGSGDNGGVHVNSGIPNKAYYLIATELGKDKTEQIYYRALANYLTASSQFTDLRIAVIEATNDLCPPADVNVIKSAFNQVGIGDGPGGNYQEDAATNPGEDLILYTKPDFDGIYLMNDDGNLLADPLSDVKIKSKPSVTDDGSYIVFVGDDKMMRSITIDWAAQTFSSGPIHPDPIWRNVIVSKDGNRIAALSDNVNNEIMVYNRSSMEWFDFELYNPTFSTGVSTGNVLYADVMEFDLTSNYILYDAFNEIQSNSGDPIRYWDMGFIKVWDEDNNDFDEGTIFKPFPNLDEGISIGNPTFSKNSPYIIAFDVFGTDLRQIIGANLETGEFGLIFENNVLGYPNFSKDDDKIVFDLKVNTNEELGVLPLNDNKITANPPSSVPWFFNSPRASKWGVWFGNGQRILSDIENVLATDKEFKIYPNPTSYQLTIDANEELDYEKIAIYNMLGKVVYSSIKKSNGNQNIIDVSHLGNGSYYVSLVGKAKKYSRNFVITK